MHASTERPLKVLTPEFSRRLGAFNAAARSLQAQGIRLHRIAVTENLLVISPEDGQALLRQRVTESYQVFRSAGSTRYSVVYQGVVLEWREPISYARPEELPGRDLTFH